MSVQLGEAVTGVMYILMESEAARKGCQVMRVRWLSRSAFAMVGGGDAVVVLDGHSQARTGSGVGYHCAACSVGIGR
jgi:hypothetical protein